MNIAFLGLGRMGRILAGHLIDAGHDVTVWNRTMSVAEEFRSTASVASTPTDAINDAEVVFTVLFGPDTVRDVIINPDLPLSGKTWIDVTTVSPADTQDFAQWAQDNAVNYVHSPVIGSLIPARARSLGVLLGGDAAGVAVAQPLVSLWADSERLVTYDTAAKAATGKLIANLALAVSLKGVTEALRLGHAGGLSTEEILQSLARGTMLQSMVAMKGETILNGAFSDAQFAVDAVAKDTALMLNTCGDLPALQAARESFLTALDNGLGDYDLSVIAKDT